MAAVLAPAGIAPRSGSTGRPHDRSAPAPLLAAVGLEDVSQDRTRSPTGRRRSTRSYSSWSWWTTCGTPSSKGRPPLRPSDALRTAVETAALVLLSAVCQHFDRTARCRTSRSDELSAFRAKVERCGGRQHDVLFADVTGMACKRSGVQIPSAPLLPVRRSCSSAGVTSEQPLLGWSDPQGSGVSKSLHDPGR